jgi:hypothetical protein
MVALTVAVESNWRHSMKLRIVKSALAALLVGGAVAGCATSVDWGGPLLHYRYNYDSRPVVSEAPVAVPAPTVTYREPTVTQYPDSVVTYRPYREPVVTYYEPSVVYGRPLQPSPFTDKGE